MVIVSAIISAVATVFIAYFTWQNFNMYKIIQKKDEEYKTQTRDLYQAIVISNLIYTGQVSTQAINEFKTHYKGKTEIF